MENDDRLRRPRVDHCVVQYFYAHSLGEEFAYPTARGLTDPRELTTMYLECALVQAASLRLRDTACEQVFVWNVADPYDDTFVDERGARLVREMEALGVQMRCAQYEHQFTAPNPWYMASRYILDAIQSVSNAAHAEQFLWFTDLDCFWWNPQQVFEAAPSAPEIACLPMPYPPDWDMMLGTTPTTVGRLGARLGPCPVPVPWIGGEMLGATAATLRDFVAACETLEMKVSEQPQELPAEEHLFSLLGGLGRVQYRDLSVVGRRVFTGPRHTGPKLDDPTTVGFWHLPMEKGLSFRRTANALLKGQHENLARDFSDPTRAIRRFNVGTPRLRRRLRDDGWLTINRLRR